MQGERRATHGRQGHPVAMPERIRLRRTAGWRKPPGAVTVARPSEFGNPFMAYGSPMARDKEAGRVVPNADRNAATYALGVR